MDNMDNHKDTDDNIKGVHCSTTEFKLQGNNCQMFANMVHTANLLVVESLECGYLVNSVLTYGWLAKYNTATCTSMVYEVNFINNTSGYWA